MFIFIYTESLHLEKKGCESTIKRDQIKENILHGFKIKQINYNQSGPNINVVFVAMQSKVDVISKSWAKQRPFSTFGTFDFGVFACTFCNNAHKYTCY